MHAEKALCGACSSPARWLICSWRAGIYCAVSRRNASASRPGKPADIASGINTAQSPRFASNDQIAMPKSKPPSAYSDVPQQAAMVESILHQIRVPIFGA